MCNQLLASEKTGKLICIFSLHYAMLWPHTTWNWRSSRTSSDITVKWPLLPKSSSMHSRFRKCTTGTEIPCVSFCKVSWFLNDMWKNSKSENTHVTNNNNLGTRSSLEYRNNSDFPRDDVVKLFREQQASGRSKWCEKVVATVPTDEPKDQPPMFKWVLTVMILRDIKLCTGTSTGFTHGFIRWNR